MSKENRLGQQYLQSCHTPHAQEWWWLLKLGYFTLFTELFYNGLIKMPRNIDLTIIFKNSDNKKDCMNEWKNKQMNKWMNAKIRWMLLTQPKNSTHRDHLINQGVNTALLWWPLEWADTHTQTHTDTLKALHLFAAKMDIHLWLAFVLLSETVIGWLFISLWLH